MTTTYIVLVNELLRRLNEVAINVADFDSVRNVQSVAKDAINSSVREILQEAQEWPFTLITYTQELTAGVKTYDFPDDFSTADWETFYLKASPTTQPAVLPAMTYEMYVRGYRTSEDSGGVGAYKSPTNVYKTQEDKFGVTPIPDQNYSVEYRYWKYPQDLTLADDICVIPSRYKHVVIDGAMMYMMRFRSNEQSAAIHQQKFEEGIKTMRRLVVGNPTQVYSTVLGQSQGTSTVKQSSF